MAGTGFHRIQFRTNIRKALEVILWCAEKRGTVDFHTILKVLFGADLFHLNQYGRPVVGDTYNALPYGPVPQTTYDILKREPLALEELGTNTLPFSVEGSYIELADHSIKVAQVRGDCRQPCPQCVGLAGQLGAALDQAGDNVIGHAGSPVRKGLKYYTGQRVRAIGT